jgi:diaminohydroxyphosphoribosylaminopyrimidine deaminase / 5-amino-6-(5-phosphoribosylamino)uracil reductase
VVTDFDDVYYMRKALGIAERGRGRTSPNPMVGAVVVDGDGTIVGRGRHEFAGGPHAEVNALADAGPKARGATLYCTLEPCCHTGRTGPCAPLVADAGISRVVVAIEDPNPLVHGGGLRYLESRGVRTTVGVLHAEAERQNEAFFTLMRRRRPLVILKAAVSADGAIAAAGGRAVKLTGAAADRRIHRQRAEVDAIAVGSGTILADDPLLTPRGACRVRPLTRVIFDTRLRTPPSARVLSTLDAGPVIIISTAEAQAGALDAARALVQRGARLELLDHRDLRHALTRLGALGLTSIVIEGGAALHRAALDAGVVDVMEVYVTPKRLGADSVLWIGDRFAVEELRDRRVTVLGEDVLVAGYVHRID